MGKVIRHFCWHPWGLSVPAPGLYTFIKSWKILYKIRLQSHFFLKLATNEWSDKTFMLTSKLCPLGAVCHCPGAIYMYKIMKKKCIKSDFKQIILNLQQMTEDTRCSWWHQNFVPKGLSAPAPGLYTCIKSWKKVCKIRLQRVFWNLCNKKFLLTSKFCPLGLSAPDLRLHTFIKLWKDVNKVRGWRDSF